MTDYNLANEIIAGAKEVPVVLYISQELLDKLPVIVSKGETFFAGIPVFIIEKGWRLEKRGFCRKCGMPLQADDIQCPHCTDNKPMEYDTDGLG